MKLQFGLATAIVVSSAILSFEVKAASVEAFTFTSATFATFDSLAGELGYQFTTGADAVSLDGLGYINDGSNTTHAVELFNVTTHAAIPGALATVTTAGGGPNSTSFTYALLATPIILDPNTQYELVSQFFADEHYFVHAVGIASNEGLTIGNAVYDYGNSSLTPTFPGGTTTSNFPGDFGPNMLVSDVPEPGSFSLVAAGLLALVGRGWVARRRG